MKIKLRRFRLFWFLGTMLLFLGCNVAAKKVALNKIPDNIILEPENVAANELINYDSVLVIATDQYEAGAWKRMMQGKNYRSAWGAPVWAKVVRLDTLYGGLRPVEKGGGNQTRSMDLQDSAGVYYTIRSVTKNPINLIPQWMWTLGLQNVVVDGISAGHPYGALVMPALSDAVGVLHTHQQLIFLPFQPALDTFNQLYGNRLFLLEYEPQGKHAPWTGLSNLVKIIDTKDVRKKMERNPQLKVEERAVVRARLLDILVGDWDRHSKQWEWAMCATDGDTTFYPIPTDRDNVFYGVSGVIPWIVNRPIFEERLRPFRKEVDYFPGLVANAKYFDSFFLLHVPKTVFLEEAQKMQQALTDEVIETAITCWPQLLYELNGEEIVEKIKARRDQLVAYANNFYEILQNQGFIPQPDEPEVKTDLRI